MSSNGNVRMQNTGVFSCDFCGEENTVTVDLSAGTLQDYVEDCQVCCRPNRLRVYFDQESLEASIQATYDG